MEMCGAFDSAVMVRFVIKREDEPLLAPLTRRRSVARPTAMIGPYYRTQKAQPRLPAFLLCAAAAAFDSTLRSMLARAERLGADAAVRERMVELDGRFVALLGSRIEAVAERGDEYEPLLDLLDAIDRAHQPENDNPAVDVLLAEHWPDDEGFLLDDAEAARIDQQSPDAAVGHASAYGEVTPRGARALFEAMGLLEAEGAVFFDLGSGVGRLVAQAWLELPADRLARAIGVELSPSRHALASHSRASLLGAVGGSALPAARRREDGGSAFELRCGSMCSEELDLSAATHVYVASLCMGDELLDTLWARLQKRTPRLRVIASLREFRPAPACTAIAEVEMTWNGEGEPGALVYVYEVGAD